MRKINYRGGLFMWKTTAVIIGGVLILNSTSIESYSSSETLVRNESSTLISAIDNKRRDDKKKYVGEVKSEKSTKRYVGDVDKDEVENSKRRGTQKRYVNTEEEEELFFKKEKDNSFKYDYEDAKLKHDTSDNAKYNIDQKKEELLLEDEENIE